MRRSVIALFAAVILLAGQATSPAHETDHFYFAPGRDMVDFGDYFTHWAYATLARAVEAANEDARDAIDRGDDEALEAIGTQAYIFDVTYRQFPNAYFVIEGLESLVETDETRAAQPGKVVHNKEFFLTGAYAGAYLPLDPRLIFRVWQASVIQAYGVYFGTDKVGHFTDMGKNYYQAYARALSDGATEEEARAAAVSLGTTHLIYSESALLGYWTAGAYSNGDLAANYAGFLFYKNLTETVDVAGETRPPLLEWDGQRWHLAEHVRPDSDFFSYFITDHWDEALNPSLYEFTMRPGMRRNIVSQATDVLWRYRDENGNRRPPTWFVDKAAELSTFAGEDYGHDGNLRQLITLAEFYEPFDANAPHDARNERGYTPLHDATAWNRVGRVQQLLAEGADPDVRIVSDEEWNPDQGATPLHLAARAGHVEAARVLLRHAAAADARDARHATPLHHAAGYPKLTEMLLEASGDGGLVNARTDIEQTPLHWAAARGDAASMQLLLAHEAAADVADRHGRTALHLAARHGTASTVEVLAEHAGLDHADRYGQQAIHVAAARPDAAAAEVVRALLEAGAVADATDERGRTPAHEAARIGRRDALAALREHGGGIDVADHFGNTPLHLAARQGRDTLAGYLITRGASPNVINAAGVTPLHDAAFAGRPQIVQLLLDHEADAAIANTRDQTPAEVAADRDFHQIAGAIRQHLTYTTHFAIEAEE